MSHELIEYIKEQLNSGESRDSITEKLEGVGWDKKSINEVLTKLDPEAVIGQEIPLPLEHESEPHFNTTKAFSIIGAILILVAFITVISSTWTNVSPLVRILYLAVPMILLFGLSFYLRPQKKYHSIASLAQILGATMFPFVLGTFLYQTKILTKIDAPLFIWTSGISLLFYLISEFLYNQIKYAFLTSVISQVLAISLIFKYELRLAPSFWICAGVSLFFIMLGLFLRQKREDGGIFLLLNTTIASFILPLATRFSVVDEIFSTPGGIARFIDTIFGLTYVALAPLFYKYYLTTKDRVLYTTKRYLEEFGVFTAILSLMFMLDRSSFGIFLLLGLSLISIFANIKFKIKLMPILGALGLINSVFAITDKFFPSSTNWPIAIFLAGFLALGLALLSKKLSKEANHSAKIKPFYGLGIDKEAEKNGPRSSAMNVIIAIISIIVILNLVSFVLMQVMFPREYRDDPAGFYETNFD